MKNYSRNDELCQKLCLHSLSKPKDDEPCISSRNTKNFVVPLDKYKSGCDSMSFMAPLGPIFQHSMTENVFY